MAVFLRIYWVILVVGMGIVSDGVLRVGGNRVQHSEPTPTTHKLQLCQWLIS